MDQLSLRQRFALAGIGVALLAVVVTAFAVQRLTESTIRTALAVDLDVERDIRDSLAFFGAVNGGWGGVESEIVRLAVETDQRIAVATLDGRILADSAVLLDGEDSAPLPAQATIVDPASDLFEFQVSERDLAQIEAENDAVSFCLDIVGVPAIVDDEELGIVAPARELSEVEATEVFECVTELLEDEPFDEGDDVAEPIEDEPFDEGDDVAEPMEEALPPLQLFIGYGDEREGIFPSGLSSGFWLAIAAVLAAAVAVTAYLAGRISRPIGSLTAAARAMSGGDLSARVPVGGSDEIAQLSQAFNEMAESIEAEDRARRTLTTDVAHELRSPLANLRGYLEAIQDDVVAPDAATIASLLEEATALQVLVDDLQQLSLAEAGRLTLREAEHDVGDLLARAVSAHRPAAASAGVTLTASAPPGIVRTVDGDRVRQIITNLIVNAIRHTPTGGRVEVALGGGDPTTVEVRDTGEGIEAEHLPHLFDRFYRVDPSRTRNTGGSGLGLAIAHELARAHGGRLEVESEVGHGSTFRLLLPS